MPKTRIVVLVCLAITIGAILLVKLCGHSESLYSTFTSPNGQYTLEVYARSWHIFPGQSGDAPGVVKLRDNSGTVMHKMPLEMVQLVDQPEWRTNGVAVKLLFDWNFEGTRPSLEK